MNLADFPGLCVRHLQNGPLKLCADGKKLWLAAYEEAKWSNAAN